MVKNGWKTIEFPDALGIHFIGAKVDVPITTFVRMNSILFEDNLKYACEIFSLTSLVGF
jgi:hypothetical protein